MKKYLFLLSFIPATAFSQQHYVVKGAVKERDEPMTACVFYRVDRKPVLDTVAVKDGHFTITGTIPYALKATVFVRPSRYSFFKTPEANDQVDVYLEPGTVTVNATDSIKYGIIGGTPLNNDYRELVKLEAPFIIEDEALSIARRRAEDYPEHMPKVKAAYKEMASRKKPAEEAFIQKHLNSLVGLELLATSVDPAFELAKAKSYFSKFPKALQESMSGKTYAHLFGVAVGCMAPDFTVKDVDHQDATLSSYRGKYLLVDFWASWCMPCRADNPHMKKVYAQYKSPDFEILGVSMDYTDQGEKYWLRAVRFDSLTWRQASDLQGFGSGVGKLYGLTAVPTNFLIDPSGKIIAKNLRGEDLDNKLAELFGKK